MSGAQRRPPGGSDSRGNHPFRAHLSPPEEVYPLDPWELVENRFTPRFLAQTETLFALSATRAEAVLAKIVDQHGLMGDDRVDRTRALAAEMLGAHADSDVAMAALTSAQRLRPWNTPVIRDAASSCGNEPASVC